MRQRLHDGHEHTLSFGVSGAAIETNDDRDERLHVDAFYRGVTFYCRMLKVGMS